MQKKHVKKVLSLLLCAVLIAAIALFVGCGADKNPETPKQQEQQGSTDSSTNESALPDTEKPSPQVLGEGKTEFSFSVVDLDGKETFFEIHTDKKTVGEALLDIELIAGDEGAYGLYVKTVNGVTLDYEKDGAYWSFYIGDEYATSGVDSTEIIPGKAYTFKAEKA